MTARSRRRFALDVVLRPARFLVDAGQLGEVQRILQQYARRWCEGAHLWRPRSDQDQLDLANPRALEEILWKDEAQRKNAPMAKMIEARMGPPAHSRLLGSMELRGKDDTLTVVIHADEYVLAPLAREWIFGNRVTLQVRRSKVEGVDAVKWSAEVFEALCSALSPLHGDVHTWDEYDAKNMSHEGGGLQAVGVDASKYLPGLYWLNFLGKPYCDLMNRDRLLSTPGAEVREVDDGVLLRLAGDPRMWSSAEYKAVERLVLEHVGTQYFFSKDEPERHTVAPAFDLRSGTEVS